MKTVAPYGSWKSPITSEAVSSGLLGTWLGEVRLDGQDLYWDEPRPTERGRITLLRRTADGHVTEATPFPFSARSLVHDGGMSFAVGDGDLYFSNYDDQRLYRMGGDGRPRPITPPADLRYADGELDSRRGRLVCVREDRTVAGREEVDTIVSLDLSGSDGGEFLVGGDDFYASPRLSPDGSRLAWLCWHHPYMMWDETELWVAEVKPDGSLGQKQRVMGGVEEPIVGPQWSPDNILYFLAERDGWLSLHRWHNGQVELVCELDHTDMAGLGFGAVHPYYVFEPPQHILLAFTKHGTYHLARLNTATQALETIETPYTQIWSLQAAPGRLVFGASSPTQRACIVELDLASRELGVLYRTGEVDVDPAYLSVPQYIEFPTEHGLTAYGWFYPPKNGDYTAPPGELPPLVVQVHGGPHAAPLTALRLDLQYWTSRGFGVLDVIYGGSTGHGREFRKRLDGQWPIVDVVDSVNGALHLAQQGQVDGNRMVIRGASSGGTAAVCGLTFHDVFAAGTSYYGDTDFELSAKITHKLESHYIDSLIGPYPEMRDVYLERSPLFHAERVTKPLLFFQGLEDPSINPPQTEGMVAALRKAGKPVAYIPFKREQHALRRAENAKRAMDAELYFYARILGFDLAEPIEPPPIVIDNL